MYATAVAAIKMGTLITTTTKRCAAAGGSSVPPPPEPPSPSFGLMPPLAAGPWCTFSRFHVYNFG